MEFWRIIRKLEFWKIEVLKNYLRMEFQKIKLEEFFLIGKTFFKKREIKF